ncbi:hypothetical protein [Haloarchaeobius sp. HRN-SO-5]|uniref:hypothetical protein n=1 Tax=Haloarchaeobius sp. HRN-SO-5 TaxID=3446118 RepID=UPI003EBC1222
MIPRVRREAHRLRNIWRPSRASWSYHYQLASRAGSGPISAIADLATMTHHWQNHALAEGASIHGEPMMNHDDREDLPTTTAGDFA